MCATQCLLDALLQLLRVFPVLGASGLRVYGVFGRVIYTRCLGCGWIEMGGSRRAEDFEEELVVTTLVFQVSGSACWQRFVVDKLGPISNKATQV